MKYQYIVSCQCCFPHNIISLQVLMNLLLIAFHYLIVDAFFVVDRERLDPLELLAPLELRDLEESLVLMALLAPLVPL